MNLEDFDRTMQLKEDDLYDIDLWALHQANQCSQAMTNYLNNYEYGLAKIEFEKFFWHDFCDNYLEIVKDKIYKPEKYTDGDKQKTSAQFALYHTFLAIIKMIAPYLPFVTEELYQNYYRENVKSESVHVLPFPNGDIFKISEGMSDTVADIEELLVIIEKVRGYKTDKQLGL